ncbi:MAG: glycoside hydrolase N-terminal domain-containing protein [Planctomycetes bacterium]|nr:glycoside hydrolase N-terminal domain-containing protein [Planctomycetota bacterium]
MSTIVPIRHASEVLPESHLRFKADLTRRISTHDMVWGDPSGPPSSWKEGAPIGNGDFGALVYGSPDNLCLAMGKTDLWDRSSTAMSHFPHGHFEDLRQAYLKQDRQRFQEICESGPKHPRAHVTTAGMFRLHLWDGDLLSRPQLRVSLWDGIAAWSFKPHGVEGGSPLPRYKSHEPTGVDILASRAYQVIAIRIHKNFSPPSAVTWEMSRSEYPPHPRPTVGRRGAVSWLRQPFSNDDAYAVAMAATGGEVQPFIAGHRIVGEIRGNETSELVVYLAIVSTRDSADPVAEACARLVAALSAGYPEILLRHQAWWHDYWRRAYVCIGDPAVEKWWYTSLYLCASTIEPGRQSPGLQGVWIKENIPAWCGDYHSNVNLQAVYWGLFGANRVAFLEPYARLLEQMAGKCRKDTHRYFQMRGIRFPHAGDPDGHEMTGGNWSHLGLNPGASSWLTQLLWQIYDYTGDREFLRGHAYPLLKEVALFFQDYLRWDEKAGRWAIEPSVHFECRMPGFEGWGKNSLYEVTLFLGAFHRAIAAARALDADPDLAAQWEAILAQLPDFPTDPQTGSWITFEGRDERMSGSHQYSLPPVFPEELVSLWHGPEPWRQQAIATLNHPATTKSITGHAWCGGQGIREIIRMGQVDKAFEAARWSKSDNANGLIHNWASYFVQADHGPGMCSVLTDMLVLSLGGILRLFPCFPTSVPAAFHSLRAPGGFLISAEKRGETVDYALVQSLVGNSLRLANPWPGRARLRDRSSGQVLHHSADRDLTVSTTAGQVLLLDREEAPFEAIPAIDL